MIHLFITIGQKPGALFNCCGENRLHLLPNPVNKQPIGRLLNINIYSQSINSENHASIFIPLLYASEPNICTNVCSNLYKIIIVIRINNNANIMLLFREVSAEPSESSTACDFGIALGWLDLVLQTSAISQWSPTTSPLHLQLPYNEGGRTLH